MKTKYYCVCDNPSPRFSVGKNGEGIDECKICCNEIDWVGNKQMKDNKYCKCVYPRIGVDGSAICWCTACNKDGKEIAICTVCHNEIDWAKVWGDIPVYTEVVEPTPEIKVYCKNCTCFSTGNDCDPNQFCLAQENIFTKDTWYESVKGRKNTPEELNQNNLCKYYKEKKKL